MEGIYLDHSATTPVRPEVFDAMAPYLREQFGNPGSVHGFGRAARRAIDDARDQVAALINADPRDVYFTSGGTEADNLALRGIPAASTPSKCHIVASAVEHHAVLHAAGYAERHEGCSLTVSEPDSEGRIDPSAIEEALTPETVLVSLMHGNNETGVLQPIEEVAKLCAERGVLFHTDAVQSAGQVPVDVQALPVAMLAMSGHKLYAPKGVGACYVRKDTPFEPQAIGGAQERGRRAGTENVPGIVALGKACELARAELAQEAARLGALRDRLERGILERIPDTRVHGGTVSRLPHITNISFGGVEGESVILSLDMEGIAASTGSACTSGSLDPSHVLLAMGLDHTEAQTAVRFSLGRANDEAQIDRVLDILPPLIERLRAASPLTSAQ